MKFLNVLQSLYCEPWYILPAMHNQICEIVNQHITGAAHLPNGIAEYEKQDVEDQVIQAGKIAIINIHGVIAKRIGNMEKMSGGTDIADLESTLMDIAGNMEIAGVLLHIDSPGGAAIGIHEIAEMIANFEKPIVAFTDRLMDSCGYYLAAGADVIVASKTASVGCIGTYIALLDVSAAYAKDGIKLELFKSGKFKALGAPGSSLDEDQRAYLQAKVDKFSGLFFDFVNANRVVNPAVFDAAEYSGGDALAMGLVDKIGNIDTALDELRALIDGI